MPADVKPAKKDKGNMENNEDDLPPNMLQLGAAFLGVSMLMWGLIYVLYWGWSQ